MSTSRATIIWSALAATNFITMLASMISEKNAWGIAHTTILTATVFLAGHCHGVGVEDEDSSEGDDNAE